MRAFVGGAGRAELSSAGDAEIVRIVTEELREIAGIGGSALFTRVYRWPRSMPRYTVGHLDRVAAIDERAAAFPGLYLIGASLRGIGIGDCVRSGFNAAEEITKCCDRRQFNSEARLACRAFGSLESRE